MSLGDLARSDAAGPSAGVDAYSILCERLARSAIPVAASLGIAPEVARLLVTAIAAHAAGLVRELQVEQIRTQTVVVRDDRP